MTEVKKSAPESRSRDAGILVMGRLLATISDALLPIVIVRLLGKTDVGVLSSVLLIYGTVAMMLTTGIPSALMFHLPGRPEPERRALTVQAARGLFGFGVFIALAIVGSGLLGTFAPTLLAELVPGDSAALLDGGIKHLFWLAAFPLGDLPARMLPNLLVIEHRASWAARYAIVSSLVSSLCVLVPAGLGCSIQTVLLSYSAVGLLQGAALLVFLRLIYRGVERVRAPIPFVESLRFAVPLGLTDIVSMLSGRIDRYLISISFPLARFAEYQAGAFQIPILTTIAYTVGTVYTPVLAELFRDGKNAEAIATWREPIHKVALIVVPVSAVFVVAAEEFVELLFTSAYLPAAPIFRCYAFLTMGRVATFGSVLVAAGKPQLILRAAVGSLLVTGILCGVGLKVLGFVGPALGNTLAFIPMVAIYCAYIAQATKLPFSSVFPLARLAKLTLTVAVCAIPATLVKLYLPFPALARFGAVAFVLLAMFALLGSLTSQITREDWGYFVNSVRPRRAPSAGSTAPAPLE